MSQLAVDLGCGLPSLRIARTSNDPPLLSVQSRISRVSWHSGNLHRRAGEVAHFLHACHLAGEVIRSGYFCGGALRGARGDNPISGIHERIANMYLGEHLNNECVGTWRSVRQFHSRQSSERTAEDHIIIVQPPVTAELSIGVFRYAKGYIEKAAIYRTAQCVIRIVCYASEGEIIFIIVVAKTVSAPLAWRAHTTTPRRLEPEPESPAHHPRSAHRIASHARHVRRTRQPHAAIAASPVVAPPTSGRYSWCQHTISLMPRMRPPSRRMRASSRSARTSHAQ